MSTEKHFPISDINFAVAYKLIARLSLCRVMNIRIFQDSHASNLAIFVLSIAALSSKLRFVRLLADDHLKRSGL